MEAQRKARKGKPEKIEGDFSEVKMREGANRRAQRGEGKSSRKGGQERAENGNQGGE